MKFVKIETPTSGDFKEAWKIYESSFPSDERRETDAQVRLFDNNLYNFSAVYEDGIVGIIAHWDFQDFVFIEHIAVREDLRGRGIGTRLLENYLNEQHRRVVLEVERPEKEVAKRRVAFYERLGFTLNEYDYIQPPYEKNKNPVSMFLMTYPEAINESEFSAIREKLHTIVYGLKSPLLGGRK